MSKPEQMINKVKKMNQSAMAITEHGSLFSSVKIYKECKKQSVKYIHGCELYISPKSRFDKDKDNKYYHMTVLAKNEKGRLNLNKLVTKGYLEGFYSKPRVDFELLKQHSEGLIIFSGCMAGQVQQTLASGKIGNKEDIIITEQGITEAKGVIKKYKEVFKDDYYLEIQSHRDIKQRRLNRAIVDIAKEMNVEYVVTADSHYTEEEDFDLHGIFIQIGQNREAGETYLDAFLQSESDVMRLLQPTLTEEEAEIAIRATRLIADKCNVHIPLSAPLIPHVDIPFEYKNEEEYLKDLCNTGWKQRGINKKDKNTRKIYQERLEYEFNAVRDMGFIGYFLLVYSYVNSVERRGIARGSGGGCLIAYLLNIVDIDPIKYGLYFERFIDVGQLDLLKEGIITPKELKIPDVDSDFGTKDREKVVQNIEEKYTKKKFASLGQFGYIWDKSAIKDVGRVLGIDFNILNNITKDLNDLTIQDAREEGYTQKWEKRYPQLFMYAEKLAGLPRSFGVHPCGKAITIDELDYYHALAENDGHLVFQMDMNDAEDLGIVKVDLLGLRTVDVYYDVLDMIKKKYREYLDPAIIDFDDEKVYKEVFQKGFTDGVFQFELVKWLTCSGDTTRLNFVNSIA
jgi:DNA polymerase-3 subunit alpha